MECLKQEELFEVEGGTVVLEIYYELRDWVLYSMDDFIQGIKDGIEDTWEG